MKTIPECMIQIVPFAKCVLVANIPEDFSNQQLLNIFRQFGRIVNVATEVDIRGQKTGTGIVRYHDFESTFTAVNECSKKFLFAHDR